MNQLANYATQAADMVLEYSTLPPQQIISGTPRVGIAQLGVLGGCQIGVWEMSPSVTTDVEVDEFFLVLSGMATVSFDDGSPALQLKPGSVARLTEGAATTWRVTETLRKVYISCSIGG